MIDPNKIIWDNEITEHDGKYLFRYVHNYLIEYDHAMANIQIIDIHDDVTFNCDIYVLQMLIDEAIEGRKRLLNGQNRTTDPS